MDFQLAAISLKLIVAEFIATNIGWSDSSAYYRLRASTFGGAFYKHDHLQEVFSNT